MSRPLPPGSHVLLVLPTPSLDGVVGPSAELILDGRRYQLVPVPSDGEVPAPVPAPVKELPASFTGSGLLTTRELQVVALVAAGRVNKEIATELSISSWTVSAHLRRIFAKLGVDTRAAMVSRCFGASAD
ncbi:LuxR family transcriptional regulator [Myxococcus stipitatus DSM 14675]|uniref:LuxR family transcriptional regulator n=1 Tax=Myxococcus stipitatus (strain DSM 14675 / JCM 12634 / Mx s8) TaxID=1278073 RepID=L7UKD5_MYXSD|nr:helix-turn-helix transcriptional regulator [Myxococcus stipitatus]AGC48473.1 LuxR family transcriptional regulator [Myxococcus stipitatus DSM 14675]